MSSKIKDGHVHNKINLLDSSLMSMGNIIGSGIFSMTGVAIATAGPGVAITFLIAGLAVMLQNIPLMYMGSALPSNAGQYMYISKFMHPQLGLLYQWNKLLEILDLSVLAIAAGQYLPAVFPFLTQRSAGIILLIFISIICLFNIKSSAIVQNIMVGVIIVAVGLFVFLGFGHISSYSFKGMVSTTGILPIIIAVAYLRSSLYGASALTNIADEIEEPQKTVPLAMLISTVACCIMYSLIGFVSSHVVPWQEMANKPLSYAAKVFMPSSIFVFFVTGGALFALLTTLLSSILNSSRVFCKAASDRIFPAWFEAKNRFGVPYRIIIIQCVIAMIPVLFNIPLKYVFAIETAPSFLLGLLPIVTAVIAPYKLPKRFKRSYFHLPKLIIWMVVILHVGFTVFLSYTLFTTLTLPTIIGIVIFYGFGFVYFYNRCKYFKEKSGIDLTEGMGALDPKWLTDDMPEKAAGSGKA